MSVIKILVAKMLTVQMLSDILHVHEEAVFMLAVKKCFDVNECFVDNQCSARADCINTFGSYSCSCKTGYTGDGAACLNIDECNSTNSCGQNENWNDTGGSYVCSCKWI